MPKTKKAKKSAAKRNLPALKPVSPKRFLTGLIWPLIAFFLLSVILINAVLYSRSLSDPVFVARMKMTSMSKGERYFGRLMLWNYYAQNGDWVSAARLESGLDQADIIHYKENHHPDSIKKRLNQIIIKPDKSVEDWIQLTRYYVSIGKVAEAKKSITQARKMDPIRSDIEKIYQELHSTL